eukprot:scpid76062/ scgid28736/ 
MWSGVHRVVQANAQWCTRLVLRRGLAVKREIASTAAQRKANSRRDSGVRDQIQYDERWWRSSPDKVQRLREGLVALDQSTWHGFRPLRIFSLAAIIGMVALYAFRDEVREYFAEEVAGVANRSMGDEELIRRAGVLATSVVSDQAVRDQTTVLLKSSVQALLADEELRKQMLGYLAELIRDENTKKAVAGSLYDLVQTPEVQQFMSEFFVTALQSQAVTDQVNAVAKDATQHVLEDELVRMMASDALWDVVRGSVWKKAEKPPSPPPKT